MRITLNGETKEMHGVATVQALMEHLQLQATQVAVERNGQIVPRATYPQANLSDGDTIEIVKFIGGG